ncbi:MAG: triose-phosphate isomerase [Tenericutes bacterium]|nr:triose-phosphate isomerase [Mycoplasmatota bacterium]
MDRMDLERIIRQEIINSLFQTQEFLVVGNWKMNKTKQEVIEFLNKISGYDFGQKNTVVVAPPNPYLYLFEEKLRYTKVLYGVQNFYPEEKGAFTGEISLAMARDFGCKYAIVGHSERRTIFMECDEFTSRKVEFCIKNSIKPILCIGENLKQRKEEDYKQFLVNQIKEGLSLIGENELSNIIIAYEPIWAIGTGETATPEQVEETHMFIRKFLIDHFGSEIGKEIPLLYGGSVKPSNVKELALAESVSGFLIGGASLNAQSFIEINDILNGK